MSNCPLYLSLLIVFASLFACKNDVKTPETGVTAPTPAEKPATPVVQYEALPATTEGSTLYKVTSGKVYWTAAKNFGAKHNGAFNIPSGNVYVKENKLIGADATIDINSMTVLDLTDGGEKKDFLAHMKSADFFNAAKFPTATFKLTEILPNVNVPDYPFVMLGAMTIKGITKDFSLPAKIEVTDKQVKVTTPGFTLNRTDYGINFGSTVVGTVKEKLIQDHVSLYLELTATK